MHGTSSAFRAARQRLVGRPERGREPALLRDRSPAAHPGDAGAVELGVQAVGERACGMLWTLAQDDGEVVTDEARRDVGRPDGRAKRCCRLGDVEVAAVVTVDVVDLLEPVEVDQDDDGSVTRRQPLRFGGNGGVPTFAIEQSAEGVRMSIASHRAHRHIPPGAGGRKRARASSLHDARPVASRW